MEIKDDLLKGIEGYTTEEVFAFIKKLNNANANLFLAKDKAYNGSWQNRGVLSAELNFERKVDRIISQFYSGSITSGKEDTVENIADTFIDMANYSLLYLFLLYKKDNNIKIIVDNHIKQYEELKS